MAPLLFALPLYNLRDSYQGVKEDPTLRISAQGMAVGEQHYISYEAYTANQLTPGYREYAFANILVSGNLEAVRFFRLGQGPAIETGNKLDALVEGLAYLVIRGPWGLGYTRDGRFDLDIHGRLVTFADHYLVMGENGPIVLGKNRNPLFTPSGGIFVDGMFVDTFKLVQFADVSNIDSWNAVIYYAVDDNLKEVPDPKYRIRQGWIEGPMVIKGLTGEVPRFKHVYDGSTFVIKRVIKGYQSALGMVGGG